MNGKSFDLEIKKGNDSAIKEKKNNKINNLTETNNVPRAEISLEIVKNDKENNKDNLIRNKCGFDNCKRKLTLVEKDIKCKCGSVFCVHHKYPNDHKCNFDYKKDYKNKLEKQLDKIICEKVNKI